MIGNKWLLSNVLPSNMDFVTFRDGTKESVLGSESLNFFSLPKLRGVLLINILKANLTSISQLCDQALFVKFRKRQVYYSILGSSSYHGRKKVIR